MSLQSNTAPETGESKASEASSDQSLLSIEERSRVLSAGRLKFTLTLFVVAVLLSLSGLIFSGVSRIFDWLTPSIQQDLELKTRRGAVELSQTTQLGIVVDDLRMIAGALADYTKDSDVVGLYVLDAQGKHLFQHGNDAGQLAALFSKQRGKTHSLGELYGAWMPSEIEGSEVGRVAVLVSRARLEAGLQLRAEILLVSASGCLIALLACLLFVNMYIGPILRVTGEAFVRLERTTEAALAAARLKSQFLANMSHEIRTPMNGIIGVLDLLNRTHLSAKQLRYAQTIESSARGLLTIINDVLDFSKLEAGKYDLCVDDFDVPQLVQDVGELLSPKAHAKQLELVLRIEHDVPRAVRGDVDRVKQVLMNLVSNAVKFTEQGHVELRVSLASPSDDGPLLRFAVTDSGMGIRAEDQTQLFGMFSQVDGSLTRKQGGTGLGLAISKRLAEAMGGTVGFESTYGKGSCFWFTLKAGNAQQPSVEDQPPREAAILLVTKSEVQRDALQELIVRWGMACVPAQRAEDASELVVSRAGGFTAAVIDGAFDAADPAASTLFDLCMGEGLPVIRLLSTTQMADEATSGLQSVLCKPVRASELYNGLIALMDGGMLTTRRLPEVSDQPANWIQGRGRVLVVDDNEINRLVAVELLSELGYDTDTACNGLEAVARAKQGGYDAILMDCQMPELDGFGATAQIRQLPDPIIAKVPIIALTAHAMADDRERVLRGGMDDYATKPVRARVLERLLRRWIPSAAPAVGSPDTLELAAVPAAQGAEIALGARRDEPPGQAAPVALRAAPMSHPPADAADSEESDLDETLPRSDRAIELFLRTVPELLESLGKAVRAEDTPEVKRLAHKLKGNCLSLGATRMATACHAVERAALAGRLDFENHARLPGHLAAVTPLLNQLRRPRATNDV